jgi:hypothetical protein
MVMMKGLARSQELRISDIAFSRPKRSVCGMCTVPVLREMVEEGEDVAHDHEDGARPGLHQVAHLQHELVLRL